eukprot:4682020-Pleurochrysis_carterae.AAC.1
MHFIIGRSREDVYNDQEITAHRQAARRRATSYRRDVEKTRLLAVRRRTRWKRRLSVTVRRS